MENIVFAFNYCDCIYESASYTISLHRTRKGAEMAMEFHKAEKLKEFNELYDDEEKKEFEIEFGQMESWNIVEMNINE